MDINRPPESAAPKEFSLEEIQKQVEILLRHLSPDQKKDPIFAGLPKRSFTDGLGSYVKGQFDHYRTTLAPDMQDWGKSQVRSNLQKLGQQCEALLGRDEAIRILKRYE